MSDEPRARSRQEAATTRGEQIRSQLIEMLTTDGPQTAGDLLPRVETPGISLSEIAFQLQRLCEEGKATGAVGDTYSTIRAAESSSG
ncbi:MAG TPA: hypothetical protein VFJ57_05455 [Solirubrobacterales bacterium]|nr:hypothetical protein [Solirubrobacterales bacterium]